MAEGLSRADSPLRLYSPPVAGLSDPVPQTKLASEVHYSDKALDDLEVESTCHSH